MAKRIRTIVESDIEPQDSNVIWLKDNRYYIFGNNGWEVTNVLPEDIAGNNHIMPNLGSGLKLEKTSTGTAVIVSLSDSALQDGMHFGESGTNPLTFNAGKLGINIGNTIECPIGNLEVRCGRGLTNDNDIVNGLEVKVGSGISFDNNGAITVRTGTGLFINAGLGQVEVYLGARAVDFDGNDSTKGSPLMFNNYGQLSINLGDGLTCDTGGDGISSAPLRVLPADKTISVSQDGLKVNLIGTGGLTADNGIKLKTNLILAQDGIGTDYDGYLSISTRLIPRLFNKARSNTNEVLKNDFLNNSLVWNSATSNVAGDGFNIGPDMGGQGSDILQINTAWLRAYLRSVGLTLNTDN